MTTLTVRIDDKKATILKNKADQYGLQLEDLLTASIENLLLQPEPDFERAMKHVLIKNRELYRKLA
jgi:hypothetical protein